MPLERSHAEMRRKAKMVNYGIAYGISAFGLAQRLAFRAGKPLRSSTNTSNSFPASAISWIETIEFARGTMVMSKPSPAAAATFAISVPPISPCAVGAERNAINAPIQGSAADMIKIAMIHIHAELVRRKLKTRMLLQVHDELVFDLFTPEQEEVLPLVEEKMQNAITLESRSRSKWAWAKPGSKRTEERMKDEG